MKKNLKSVTSHALEPPSPCHKPSHLLGPPFVDNYYVCCYISMKANSRTSEWIPRDIAILTLRNISSIG